MRAKVFYAIQMLRENGIKLRSPFSKHLDDGIFELRARAGSNASRVLYFFFVNKNIVLTHGFIKKTQKTPKDEIKRAKKYRNDFFKQINKVKS